ncbi:glycosyltransferase [Paenibacillus xylaniclasticus]|uniref:glycosyltransferase n=1 Tax=Paenibacillus xylaniclasticus TaxID=588083 RepID=UPI000FDB1E72|nr:MULTISPECIES: glycosyltransferase [Paenibacillus]GFN32198.1 glycosyl transferase [Paenibacillus curdlanolyticus]
MSVDIIVPHYNQTQSLLMTLEGFTRQEEVSGLHIIVVDDGSTDSPDSIVEKLQGRLDISYVKQPNRGRAGARNAAFQALRHDYVIFNDCDRIPHPLFAARHLQRLKNNPQAVSIGSIKELYFKNPAANEARINQIVATDSKIAKETYYSKLVDHLYDVEGRSRSGIPWISTFSGNMAMHVEAIEATKGFDEQFTGWGFEHFEFGYRLHRHGFLFERERKAINYHLAHPRESNFYESSIRASHDYFYNKFPEREVELLKPFVLGELSLQDYEKSAGGGPIRWLEDAALTPLFNKLV